jgi:hypothetical protein
MSNTPLQDWIHERVAVLESSTNSDELTLAAMELAASDHPEALDALETFLRQSEFLGQLDDLTDPGQKTLHLSGVMEPLIERPSPEVARLCLNLANDPSFLADGDRTSFLLQALAGVSPMNAETIVLFQRTNDEGYFAFNAPLLVANGSPRALELFETMMLDHEVPEERRADCLHSSVALNRTRLPVLEMIMRLLSKDLEESVMIAATESVFDFKWRWFGTHPPQPPAWRTAPNDVLRFLINMSTQVKRRPNLPTELQEAINTTVETARALLARRN